jgi:hypothetical protein
MITYRLTMNRADSSYFLSSPVVSVVRGNSLQIVDSLTSATKLTK